MGELTPLGILRADQPAKARKRDFHHRAFALADAIASSTWENGGPVHLRGEPFDDSLPLPANGSTIGRVVARLKTVGARGMRCSDLSRELGADDWKLRSLLHRLKQNGVVQQTDSNTWRAA